MCKRLVIPEQEDAEREISVAQPWWRFSVRFNVAVTHRVPVARLHDMETEGVMMRWGFVPPEEERAESGVGAALVRSDAILSSHDYRKAWLYGQRCVIPLAGFYIWHLMESGVRQPFYVRLVNRAVFGVAALWERTVLDREDVIESCALLTVPANALLAEISDESQQMPAILRREDYQDWLTSPAPRAQGLLQPYPLERMVTHPVGPRVNYLEYDDPQLIRPVSDGAAS
jgi:putative SOS response-associated peptidase YedK